MERGELRCDEIVVVVLIPYAGFRRGGKLLRLVQPRIVESPLAVHLCVRDIGVPVRHAAPSGIGVQVDAGETKGGGQQSRSAFAVRPKGLTVHIELRVVSPRSPAVEDAPDLFIVLAERGGKGREDRRHGDDRADVKITVGPAVETPTDAVGEGVVDRRVTNGAGDSYCAKIAFLEK